jgi:tRNA-binding protein
MKGEMRWPICDLAGAVRMTSPTNAPIAAPIIAYDDFLKVDIRVGRVTRAEAFPEARKPAIKLWIDFGTELGEKRSSAQIVANHGPPEAMIGRLVLAVVNFPPRQIGKFMSEVLTLGVPDARGEVMLVTPSADVPIGGRLF